MALADRIFLSKYYLSYCYLVLILNSDPTSKQVRLCVSVISVVGLFFFLFLRLRAEGKTKSPRLKALKEEEVLLPRELMK